MSLGEPRSSIFKGKGCLITGLLVIAAFVGISYYQQHQLEKQRWKQMGEVMKDMVRISALNAAKKEQADKVLEEMLTKARADELSDDQKRQVDEALGPCLYYTILRRMEPEEMDAQLRARWDRAVGAFVFAFAQKPFTKEEAKPIFEAFPKPDDAGKDGRAKPEHIEKILAALDAFFKGRDIDPAQVPPFDYDQRLRLAVHRIAAALGHEGFWADAAATQPAATQSSRQ